MCGIAGVLALGARPPDPDWGARLVRGLSHRGPDGDGVYADGRIVLAHCRLAIIDTGQGGAQPMRSPEGRSVIVQNGEIYNYRERRAALMARGATFHTESDTEVLLESLERDGPLGLEPLRGMWAFALWDRGRERLLLGRDRLGKKPIVYVRTPEWFAFASEASALLDLPFVQPRVDRAVLRHWLTHLYAPAPWTMIEGMRKLPAASWLEVSRETPSALPVRWWTLPAPDPDAQPDRAWLEQFDAELVEAARLRTVSDVPIGVFLSGGVDSNVVLEALARTGHRPIRTFTLGFEGVDDERSRAAIAAKRHADEHVELVASADLSGHATEVLGHFGDPLGDSAIVTSALLAREASKHVKVILNGDGGDELFGGYPRYPFARRADLAAGVPIASAALRSRYAGRANAGEALAMLGRCGPAAAARQIGAFWRPSDLGAMLAEDTPPAAVLDPPVLPGAEGPGFVDALFAWDTGVYLPDDLLVKIDVASMMHAIENRSPLLDHRLFEHVAKLPPARRAHPLLTKPLLRRHAEGRIPAEVLRAKKHGFQLPLDQWLRGPLRSWLDGLLGGDGAIAPLFRPGVVPRLLAGYHAGEGGDLASFRLWSLAALETWARVHHVEIA